MKIRLETEAKLFIQQNILTGVYELVWSYILEYENSQNKFDDRRNAINEWKSVAKIFCIENDNIIKYAENLQKYHIRTKDALHIACSVYSDANYFITTDKQLYNLKLNGVKIINPLTFLNELEE